MRRTYLLLLALFALALTACGQDGRYSTTLITDGAHTIGASETVYGDMVIMGGRVVLADGARVTGSVYIVGGALAAEGAITGDLTIVGGTLVLGPHARIGGDLDVGGGAIERAPGATIGGRVTTSAGLQLPAESAWRNDRPATEQITWWLAEALGIAALAALAVRFRPRPVARVADAALHHPVVAGAMGMLAGVVGISLLVLMAFTIVLIPVTLLGLLLGLSTIVYGWVAFGAALGQHLAQRWRWRIASGTAAFLGTLIVMVALDLISLLPLVGDLLSLLATTVGLGAVLLTHLGTRIFVPDTVAAASLAPPQHPLEP